MIFIIIINTILLFYASIDRIILNDNTKQFENIYENKGIEICLIMIVIYIDVSFLIAYARVSGKILMDNKFISPYKIIILIGIFGLFYNLIIFLFFIIKGSNTICQNSADRENIYCFGETNYFSELFNNNILDNFIEITCTLIYIFSHFLALAFELLTIKYLNQNFILMSDNVYYEILKIKIFIPEKDKGPLWNNFIILQLAEFFKFIGLLIYLEIIELRFCGLNKNTKINISKRSFKDKIESSCDFNENFDNESVSSIDYKDNENNDGKHIEIENYNKN
jgi:hypothetical protein